MVLTSHSCEYEDEEVSDEDDTDGLTVIGAGGIEHENILQLSIDRALFYAAVVTHKHNNCNGLVLT